jgi:L-ornithine N5-monooxygenase
MQEHIHDVVGVGFGPANLAFAIAVEELQPGLDVVFLEKAGKTVWQPNMLFGTSDIQHHPLRDLVTPRNPRSRYTFTNFLFENGRLFEHFNLGRAFPIRAEYNQYISWAAGHFKHLVRYGCEVTDLEPVAGAEPHYAVRGSGGEVVRGRSIVLAPGRTPYVPSAFAKCDRTQVVHLNHFLEAVGRLKQRPGPYRIAVVGGSQSAVEILLHLAQTLPEASLTGFSRSFGYRMKDVSPFTGEVYFPEFVDTFYSASPAEKRRLIGDLHLTNYSAADADVLDSLYLELYRQRISGEERLVIHRSADIVSAQSTGDGCEIAFERIGVPGTQAERFDLVILATGFRNLGTGENQERMPPLLAPLSRWIVPDDQGCIQVGYDYSVKMMPEAGPCYLNGLCESTHGMGDAGSFSLLSLRSQRILEDLVQRIGRSAGAAGSGRSAEVAGAA